MKLLITAAQGRRAIKMGTLRSCQRTRDLIKVNSPDCIFRKRQPTIAVSTFTAAVLQSNSEHISLQPLRVEILHLAVIAHQMFALRLCSWFQKIIGYSGAAFIQQIIVHI